MCTVSMIMDHYHDKWADKWRELMPNTAPYIPPTNIPITPSPLITPEEVAEFKRLLERARAYDKAHNQPDCEIEEKRTRVRELAESLGVKIDFL